MSYLAQGLLAGAAGQGVDRHRMGMDDHLAQESVQGAFDGRPTLADCGRGQVLRDAGFTLVHGHRGELAPVEDGQDPGDVHLHPAG